MAVQGGPAMNVVVDTSPGAQVEGGSAIPVAVVTGRAVTGNKATRVVVVTNPDHIEGGPAIPVVAAPAGDPVEGGPAMRVYVVSGVLGASAPANTGLPTISGASELGATLTATTGSWSGSPTSYAYQWKRNGSAIGGATASTYVLQAADLGAAITVTITATNTAGSASATSAATNIPNWTLNDQFTTAQGAPLATPRTAEPGPGTITIVDTGNLLSISGGRIVSSGAWGTSDPKVARLATFARAVGRAFRAVVRRPAGSNNGPFVGVLTSSSGANDYTNVVTFFLRNSSAVLDIIETGSGFAQFTVGNYSNSVDADLWMIMRSTGWFYVHNNKLMYVSRLDASANVFDWRVACNQTNTAALQIDTMQNVDLGGAWASDFGIATDYKATSAAGDTIVMIADALIEHTFTAQTGVTKNIMFRYVDDNNCLICRCDQAGGSIKIFERNAGVETEKTGGTTTQTWTNGTSYRVVIMCDGTEIRTWTASTVAITGKNNTTSSFQQTATVAKVDHAGTNFASWPRNVTINP